jgi:NAD(P)-dependent dehydrogenase (short-subunit alcohol dehydrogenase family)
MQSSPKTWLITGVSSGLGRALAQSALDRGDRVAGTVRSAAAQSDFEALAPGRAHGVVLDVRDTAKIADAVRSVEVLAGGAVDILVNNAGYGLVGAVEEVSPEEARTQFEVNVFGPLALIQAVLPAMRKRRAGVIVNVTSVSGLATWQGTGVYCASKFALEAVGETLADEVAGLGIRVINVEPGGMRTDYAGRSLTRAARKIADYDATAHQSERILAGHTGQEKGDPAKMARHILAAADMPVPPRHLLLGADAMHYATRHMAALLEELGNWAPVTLDTQFDAPPQKA